MTTGHDIVEEESAEAAEERRRFLTTVLYGTDLVPETVETDLLRTGQVAAIFGVSVRTVTGWVGKGWLPCLRTPCGHMRYPAGAIYRMNVALATGEFTLG